MSPVSKPFLEHDYDQEILDEIMNEEEKSEDSPDYIQRDRAQQSFDDSHDL